MEHFCYNGQKVDEYAEESMAQSRSQISEGSLVTGDGRYPIRRNSSHCSFDIIDCHRNKILTLSTGYKKSVYHPDEEFNLTSSMMESEAWKYSITLYGDQTIDILKKKETWKNTFENLKGNNQKCIPHKNTNFTWSNGIFYLDAAKKLKEIQD